MRRPGVKRFRSNRSDLWKLDTVIWLETGCWLCALRLPFPYLLEIYSGSVSEFLNRNFKRKRLRNVQSAAAYREGMLPFWPALPCLNPNFTEIDMPLPTRQRFDEMTCLHGVFLGFPAPVEVSFAERGHDQLVNGKTLRRGGWDGNSPSM